MNELNDNVAAFDICRVEKFLVVVIVTQNYYLETVQQLFYIAAQYKFTFTSMISFFYKLCKDKHKDNKDDC